ncbi:MAG: NitT/TauT family transport system substrate-binding protein [Thermodesulfobacteriota bacterium]|nr:NitT/TauT family transport system substrate-binding protein [Thermodesulfobacteriota bacterium]
MAWIILCGLLISGCGEAPLPKAPDEVKLQLKWLHQAQFAGFYMAQEKGYYAEENIKVTFLEGGPDVDIAGSVISGKTDFGVMTPEYILTNRSMGAPLTALAAIYRRSAVVFAARADSGIVRPSDFRGKTVAAAGQGGSMEFELQLRAMMRKLKQDISKVKIVSYDPAYASFYSGEAEITAAYYTGGIIKIRKKGMKLNLIWPSDYGVNFYSDVLAATDKMISENPDLVKRFMRATLKGWQDAMEDYKQAVTVSLQYARDKDPGNQTAMMESMLPLVHTGEDHIGWMKPEVWHEMYDTMLTHGLLEKPVDVDKAYSTQFIKEIYGGKAG